MVINTTKLLPGTMLEDASGRMLAQITGVEGDSIFIERWMKHSPKGRKHSFALAKSFFRRRACGWKLAAKEKQ